MSNSESIDLNKIIPIFENEDIAAVYLFGSQATGKKHPESDLDLAILFNKKLSGLDAYLRLEKYFVQLVRLLRLEPDLIDMEQANLVLLFEILQHGKLLVENNREKNRSFIANKTIECIDFNYIVRICAKGMYRKAKENTGG